MQKKHGWKTRTSIRITSTNHEPTTKNQQVMGLRPSGFSTGSLIAMTRFLFIVILMLTSAARAGGPPDEVDMYCVYGALSESVRNHLVEEQYAAAEEVAQTMLKIDPSDSWARLYLLVALTHQGKEVPKWLAEDPWPNSEDEQVILKRVGEAILKSN